MQGNRCHDGVFGFGEGYPPRGRSDVHADLDQPIHPDLGRRLDLRRRRPARPGAAALSRDYVEMGVAVEDRRGERLRCAGRFSGITFIWSHPALSGSSPSRNPATLASLSVTLTNEIVTGTVNVDGVSYPAEPIAGGAAYELFSDLPAPGFLRLSTIGRWAYHRFLSATEVGMNGSGESRCRRR